MMHSLSRSKRAIYEQLGLIAGALVQYLSTLHCQRQKGHVLFLLCKEEFCSKIISFKIPNKS